VQVQQLFHRLMDAENALYRFQEGAQLLRSYGLEVNITQLLLESARKKDEERERADARHSGDESSEDDAAAPDALAVLDHEPAPVRPSARAQPAGESPRGEPEAAPASADEFPSRASRDG